MKSSLLLVFWCCVALTAALAYGAYRVYKVYEHDQHTKIEAEAAAVTPSDAPLSEPLADFTLTNRDGTPFHSTDLKGQVWVASFFFTSCAGPCYKMNTALAEMQDDMAAKGVKYVSISCDPKNDTPAALTRYAERFRANPAQWFFLRGDLDEVCRIGNVVFKVIVEEGTHSERVILVDRQGQIRGLYNMTQPDQVDALRTKVRALVKEKVPVDAGKQTARPAIGARAALVGIH